MVNLRHTTQITVVYFLQVSCNLCTAMNLSVGLIFVFIPQQTHVRGVYWTYIILTYTHTHTHTYIHRNIDTHTHTHTHTHSV